METLCRICLSVTESRISIFQGNFLDKIHAVSQIKIEPRECLVLLPSKLCSKCIEEIIVAYNIRNKIIETNSKLTQYENERKYNPNVKQEVIETEDVDSIELPEIHLDERSSSSDENNLKEELLDFPIEAHLMPNSLDSTKNAEDAKQPDCKNLITDSLVSSSPLESKLNSYGRRKPKVLNKICHICGKVLRAYNFRKHVRTHDNQQVSCSKCGKIFKNGESLRCHLMMHQKQPTICEVCGKKFEYKGQYRQHARLHIGRPKNAECNICKMKFINNDRLRKHYFKHTGENPYKCNDCSKCYRSASALKTHSRRHTSEKPFPCHLCPEFYYQRVSLKTHLENKHMICEDEVKKIVTTLPKPPS